MKNWFGNNGPKRESKFHLKFCRDFTAKRVYEHYHKKDILACQNGSSGASAIRKYTAARDHLFSQLDPAKVVQFEDEAVVWNKDGPPNEYKE